MRWLLAFVFVCGVSVFAEDYLTEGVDNGRTGWLKNEKVFTTSNVGSMKLLWKIKVNSTPRQMHNLFAPRHRLGRHDGPRRAELAIFAGISDELYAIDVATGEMIWEKKFDSIYPSVTTGVGSTLCPGGQTAVPVITTTPTKGKYTIYAVSWDGRLRTLDVATGADVAPPDKFAGPNGKPYALNLFNGVIYTSTAQGCGGNTNAFLSYDLADEEVEYLRAGRRRHVGPPRRRDRSGGPRVHGHRRCAVRRRNQQPRYRDRRGEARRQQAAAVRRLLCPAERQLALPPRSRSRTSRRWPSTIAGGSFSSRRARNASCGCSIATTLAVRTIARRCRRLPCSATTCRRSTGRASGARSPRGRTPTDVNGSSCPFYGPVSRTFKAPVEHARPVNGGVAAYTLEERDGKWQLIPQWLSRDMDMAEHAIVANGIVFTYASGEDASQVVPDRAFDDPAGPQAGGAVSNAGVRRIPTSRRAALYALDALTGRELWNSGNEITSWSHYSGLTVANGRAFITTFDGMVYAFGIKR